MHGGHRGLEPGADFRAGRSGDRSTRQKWGWGLQGLCLKAGSETRPVTERRGLTQPQGADPSLPATPRSVGTSLQAGDSAQVCPRLVSGGTAASRTASQVSAGPLSRAGVAADPADTAGLSSHHQHPPSSSVTPGVTGNGDRVPFGGDGMS